MKPRFRELQVVVTLVKKFDPNGGLGWMSNRPVYEIKKGAHGTIVHAFERPTEAYEVEFVTKNGQTSAMGTYGPDEISLVEHGPMPTTAPTS
jgi:hypothetical protein